MTRRRRQRNRRKRQMQLPRLPAIGLPSIRVNWTALLLPPILVACAIAAFASLNVLLDRPIERLVVEGTFQRVTPVQIEAALTPAIDSGFLTVSLRDLRERVRGLPWIDAVQIRRAWPNALIVDITEHRAAARWGDVGLLNERGELFAVRPEHAFPELPKLSGPDGSEQQVAKFYLQLRGPLDTAHLELESLTLDERGAWLLTLETGQQIRLGRHDVEQRAARFFAVVAPALANRLARIAYVDLRYTNGFAVGWLENRADTDLAERPAEGASHG